jgi:hypothetical protein
MDRPKAPALAVLVAACASAAACGLNQAGVEPRRDTIAYPASAVMDRSGEWLFVTNSNADLRYNDGTLIALSLTRAAEDRAANWGDCPQVDYARGLEPDPRFCCHDIINGTHGILECDERYYVGPRGAEGDGAGNVRIGSFAAAMVRQERQCPFYGQPDPNHVWQQLPTCMDACSDELPPGQPTVDHLLIGVRGDTSLTFVDVTPGTTEQPPGLQCATDTGDFAACDSDHRIIKTDSFLAAPTDDPDPPDVNLPDEPYALALDTSQGLLFIGHLSGNTARPFTGGFSLFEVMPRGQFALDKPKLIAPFPTPFSPNSVGSVGVSALNVRTDPAGATTGIFASSRYVPQVAPLGVTTVCPQPTQPAREIAAFPNGAYFNSPLIGGETRGIQFVHRVEPPTQPLSGRECTPDEDLSCTCANGSTGSKTCGSDLVYQGCLCSEGAFVLQRTPPALIRFDDGTTPTDILETCSSPTFLDQFDTGVGPRLFVTCFADGEIYVFDPSVPRLVKTFQVGRGPSGLVYDSGRHLGYVVGFGDNNISVIDLAPGSPTEYSVIQRIGFPRTSPR